MQLQWPPFSSEHLYAPVAQLDRVGGFEPLGREFESLRARQLQSQYFYFFISVFYQTGFSVFSAYKVICSDSENRVMKSGLYFPILLISAFPNYNARPFNALKSDEKTRRP